MDDPLKYHQETKKNVVRFVVSHLIDGYPLFEIGVHQRFYETAIGIIFIDFIHEFDQTIASQPNIRSVAISSMSIEIINLKNSIVFVLNIII